MLRVLCESSVCSVLGFMSFEVKFSQKLSSYARIKGDMENDHSRMSTRKISIIFCKNGKLPHDLLEKHPLKIQALKTVFTLIFFINHHLNKNQIKVSVVLPVAKNYVMFKFL